MDSEKMRALLAVLLRGQDIQLAAAAAMRGVAMESPVQTADTYLGMAQEILESSYKNYKHPVENLDR